MSERVQQMFAALAGRYDLANDVISLGLHRRARRRLIELTLAALPAGGQVLDLACGSGDLALRLARKGGEGYRITAADFVPEMLAIARTAAGRRGLKNIEFVEADALNMPFADSSFDAALMGFGIRNVDDPRAGLLELARVLRPGAFLGILEAGKPRAGLRRLMYRSLGGWALPLLGGLITGRPADYAYLHRTSLSFPSGAEFVELLESTGLFTECSAEPHMQGALWIYTARKS